MAFRPALFWKKIANVAAVSKPKNQIAMKAKRTQVNG
jgi:hypothetical protein